MDCLNSAACLLSPGLGGAAERVVASVAEPVGERARRFSEMLSADGPSRNVYVASNDVTVVSSSLTSGQPGAFKALTSLVREIDEISRPSVKTPVDVDLDDAESDGDFMAATQRAFQQDVMKMQMDLFRHSLVLNVVVAAKQGVSTVLQQQG